MALAVSLEGLMDMPAKEDAIEKAACIAHDLRSPLGTIHTLVTMLGWRLSAQPDLADMIATIEHNIDYMARLISEVVDLSSAEHGAMRFSHEPVELHALLRGIRARLMLTPERVEMDVAGDEDAYVVGDSTRLERVFVNLIENACKYGPHEAPVVVRVERRESFARVTVTDRGPGVASEDAEKIFELHRRLHAQLSQEGAGLGLYTSRKIVEAHGGTIGVEPASDREGACFFVELPGARIA
jgi:signal transduction histidine kinase